MPRELSIIIVFAAALALNTIAPSFFGVYAHGAVPVFLSAMLLYFGISEFSIIIGLFLAFLGEIMLGEPIGMTTMPFLAVVLALVFLQRLVNSKPLAIDDGGIGSWVIAMIVGLMLSVVSLCSTALAQYLLEGISPVFGVLLKNYAVLAYYSGTLVIFLLFFRLLSYNRPRA